MNPEIIPPSSRFCNPLRHLSLEILHGATANILHANVVHGVADEMPVKEGKKQRDCNPIAQSDSPAAFRPNPIVPS